MLLICLRFSVLHAQNNQYDIFSYKAPHGFTQMGSNGYLHYEKEKAKIIASCLYILQLPANLI